MVRISEFALAWLVYIAFFGGIGAGEFIAWMHSGGTARLLMAIVLLACFFVSASVIHRRAMDFEVGAK